FFKSIQRRFIASMSDAGSHGCVADRAIFVNEKLDEDHSLNFLPKRLFGIGDSVAPFLMEGSHACQWFRFWRYIANSIYLLLLEDRSWLGTERNDHVHNIVEEHYHADVDGTSKLQNSGELSGVLNALRTLKLCSTGNAASD